TPPGRPGQGPHRPQRPRARGQAGPCDPAGGPGIIGRLRRPTVTRYLIPLFTLSLFAPTAGSAPRLKEKDPPPIVGEWQAESRTFGGRAVDLPPTGLRLIVRADGSYTRIVGDVDPDPDGHTYKLQPEAGPDAIDMASVGKPTYLCVYKVEKEMLSLCFGQAGDPRPAAFESPAGSRT